MRKDSSQNEKRDGVERMAVVCRSGRPNSGTRLERSTLDWVTSDGKDPESSEKTEANCASGGDRRGGRYHDLVRGTIFCEHRRARESAGGH